MADSLPKPEAACCCQSRLWCRGLGLPELEPDSWVTWAIALLGVDFACYWLHRLSHVVHHQSEGNLGLFADELLAEGCSDYLITSSYFNNTARTIAVATV